MTTVRDCKQLVNHKFSANNEFYFSYHHTVLVNLLYGLREALAELCEEGLEALWLRHETCRKRLHEGLLQLGFELFVENPEHRLTTVTTIKVPGPHWRDIIAHAMNT